MNIFFERNDKRFSIIFIRRRRKQSLETKTTKKERNW
jgi:hypothetical protein